MMKKNLLTGFVCIMLLLLLCVSAAYAEDAEKNLAEYGLNPQDILLEKIKFLPDENAIRYPFSREERPFYLWFDVTGDGCVDLCTERMFGSGMVRIQLSVYDPLNQKTYILDGYDHYFLLDSITDGRIIINKKGPYGYGEPVTVTRGTVILDNNRLLFVAALEPASGEGDLFDPAQAAISADEAIRIACDYVRENPDAEYYNEATVGHIVTEDGNSCWQIMFSWIGNQRYTVWVNTKTGEVENGFSVDE